MNRRTKRATTLGALAIAGLTAVACAAPEEGDAALPEVEGAITLEQYTVPTTLPPPSPKKPTCCLPSSSCCKEWCDYHRQECGNATSCWTTKATCDRGCGGHG